MKYCVNCKEPLPSGLPDCTSTAKPEDKSLARLIAAIGKTGAAERTWFEGWFRALKRDVLNRLPAFEAEGELRELLRKFQANADERRKLREQLEPYKHELARIRHLKLAGIDLPEENRIFLGLLMDPDIMARSEQAESKDMQNFLDAATDFRKGAVRKLILEPFLVMMRNEGVEITRRLPLTEMVDALLGYLGINLRRHPRPSKSGLRTIVQEVKRDFEKRPPQHPQI